MSKKFYSVKSENILWLLFLINATIIIGNLNGVIFGLVGIVAPLSPILLVNSLVLIYTLLIKYSETAYKNYLFYIFVAFFLLHIYIGLAMGLIFYNEMVWDNNSGLYSGVRKLFPSILIFVSTYLFVAFVVKKGHLGRLISMLTFISFLAVLLIIFGNDIGLKSTIYEGMSIANSSRSAGLYANPNGAGIAANIALTLAFGNLYFQKNNVMINYAIILLSLYAAFLTFSKAAMIVSILIVFGSFFLIAAKFRKLQSFQRKRILTFISLAFIAIIYIGSVFGSYLENLDLQQLQRIQYTLELVQGNVNHQTTSNREEVWMVAFEKILNNPVFGYGLESFHSIPGIGYGAHNTFLMIWGESGIITLFLFLLFFIRASIDALFIRNKALLIIVFGIFCVYVFQDAFTSHNALENKGSIMMIAFALVLITQRKYAT